MYMHHHVLNIFTIKWKLKLSKSMILKINVRGKCSSSNIRYFNLFPRYFPVPYPIIRHLLKIQ